MQSYKKKPKSFTALQWTGDNISEFVAEEIPCIDKNGVLEVKYWSQKNSGFKKLLMGKSDYLIIPSYGKPRVRSERDFAKRFRI